MLKKKLILLACFFFAFGSLSHSSADESLPRFPQRGQVENFFFDHIRFILKYSDALSLTDKQLQRFQELNLQAQKEAILKDAEIQTIAMDLENEVKKDLIYSNHLMHFIDKKYEALKIKEKFFADGFMIIREILDDQQYSEMISLFTNQKKNIENNN
ncbi:MAG: hypothetical protein K8S27_07485 [Candidatus Omnitrophica bacterium]|nr:hypothetical protein [Candidatus Omnitrophota bacterium]